MNKKIFNLQRFAQVVSLSSGVDEYSNSESDKIFNVSDKVIVNGGVGNDTLSGDRYAQTFQYSSGGGNDVITNYSGEDIVHITSGNIDSYSFDGGDLIFHVGNGSLRLKNMKNHAITVKDSSGKTSTKIYGEGYSGQEVIKNFVKSMANTALNSKLKLDEAIQACSGFKSLQEVIDKMVADCKKANNAETFLKDYCGIILDNDDRDAATGWDAGGLKMKTKFDLFPQKGNATYPSSTTFKIRGFEITVPEKSTLSEKEQLVVQGFYSWWAEDAVKLIEDTYGLNFKGKSMKLSFFSDDTSFAWGLGSSSGVSLNSAYTSFDASDKNGSGLGDYLFPHEMTHVLQGDFNIRSYMPNYMTEGMADLTGGTTRDMSKLASDSSLLAKYLDVDNTFSSDVNVYATGYMFWRYLMKQAADSYDSLGSYAWKNKSVINGTSKAELMTSSGNYITISGGAGKDTLTAYGKKSKIYGGGGDDNILTGSSAKNLTISGGEGVDTLTNKGTAIKIYGGTNNDKIYNYGDKSTLKGESGSDFIINGQYWESEKGGKKIVIDGGESSDTITSHGKNSVLKGGAGGDLIYNGYRYYEPWTTFYAYDDENYDGSNSKVSGGSGNDTVNNKGANSKIYGGKNNDKVYNYGDKSTLKGEAGNDFIINGQYFESERGGQKVVIDGGSGVDTITSQGNNSVVKGGSGNDLIYNGYRYYEPWDTFYDPDNENYNGSNSTIIGGKGNDKITLSSSAANNVVQYASGDGKDTVVGFGTDDTLKITKGTYKTSVSGSDVIVKVGKGSVTLKDAVGKKISITDYKGKNTTKIYSSTSALFTENNFATEDNLDSILENNLPPTPDKIETPTFDTLTQEKTLITYVELQ